MKQSNNKKFAKLTRQVLAFLLAMVLMTSAFVPGLTARATEDPANPIVVEEEETPTLESLEPLKDYETAVALLADLDTIAQALPEDASEEDMKAVYDAIVTAQADAEALTDDVALTDDQKTEVADLSAAILTYLTEKRGYVPAEPEAQNDKDEEDETPTCTCPEGTEGHIEGCPLYVDPCEVCGETGTHKADCATLCTCPEGTEGHVEGCVLYVDPCEVCGETGTHKADCATLCTCPEGTEGHIEGCVLYVAPCEVCGETGTHKADCATLCTCPEGTEGHLAECPLYICADCGLNNCICGLESAYLLNGAIVYKDYTNTESDAKAITGWNTAVKIQSSVTAEDGTVWYQFVYSNVLKELLNGYHYVKAADTTTLKCTCTPVEGEHAEDCPLYVEPTPYEKAMADLTALEEEAKTLADDLDPDAEDYIEKLTEKCIDFDDRLFELLLTIEDMYMAEPATITEEEYNAAAAKYTELMEYLKDTYAYENRAIAFGDLPYETVPSVAENIEMYLFDYGTRINEGKDGSYVLNFYNNQAQDAIEGGARLNQSNPVFSPVLGSDGYPAVTGFLNASSSNVPTSKLGSLKYLFDKDSDFVQGNGTMTSYGQLATSSDYVSKTFKVNNDDGTGTGLFRKDGNYFNYSSGLNAAYFNQTTSKFELYNYLEKPGFVPETTHSYGRVDVNDLTTDAKIDAMWKKVYEENFLPFNQAHETGKDSDNTRDGVPVYEFGSASREEQTNMWFGMTMEFDFFMKPDGKMSKPDGTMEDMVFEFLGDDDVLVYIDNVLVLDMGDDHYAEYGTINFANGAVKHHDPNIDSHATYAMNYLNYTLYEKFKAAGLENTVEWVDVNNDGTPDTFADYSKHTLKFFYLERGGCYSYCSLRFNLDPVPENSLSVTKSVKNDANPNAKAFDFQVSFKDANNNALSSVSYTKNGTPGTLTLNGGVGNFQLKNNDLITFDLNAGVQYTVEELSANKNNYTTTVSGAESGTLSGSPAMVTYTNTLETGGIERDKYVTEGDQLGDYTIHLEAYATGQISSVTNAKPTDIVVAFDHSGSMLRALNFTEGKINDFNSLDPVKGSIPGYYIAHGASQAAFPFYKDGEWYYVGVNDVLGSDANSLTDKGHNAEGFDIAFNPDHFTGANVHKVSETVKNNFNNGGIWQTRFGAAYDALSGFVEKTAATGVDHNIAIVTFAKDTNYGTGMFVNGSYKQYQNGLNEADFKNAFMSVQNQKDIILNCVDDLYSGWSHTYMHAGLQMAENIFKNNPITDNSRDRMVVVINDGLPTLKEIPEHPVTVAGRLKDEQKAKIYSIGALAPTEASGILLLEKVSSNYNSSETVVSNKYFVNAINADQMDNMFDQIVTDTSGTQVELNEYTILRDTLSEHFELDESRDIKVYTADCTGKGADGFTWGEPREWTEGQFIENYDQGCTQALDVTVTDPAAGKKANERIDVKGFDYSLNYVAVSGSTARGKKLIVEIPVTMDPDNVGGTKQPTNIQAESGLYDPTDPDPIIDFPLPHADTPARINVIKMVDGNLGDRSQSFSFNAAGTLAMYDKLESDKYYTSTDDATVGNSNYLVRKTKNLDAEFSLTHSHSWAENDNPTVIDQPYEMLVPGVEITITENDIPEGYELSVSTDKGTVTEVKSGDKVIGAKFTVTPGMTITFTNTKDVTIDTGISLDSIPYIVILVGVAAVVGFLFLRKRRVED